jgi:hypothetical protein
MGVKTDVRTDVRMKVEEELDRVVAAALDRVCNFDFSAPYFEPPSMNHRTSKTRITVMRGFNEAASVGSEIERACPARNSKRAPHF